MKVLKFGGTSVGSSKNINKVIDILDNYSKKVTISVVFLENLITFATRAK